ncbi:MAG: hypothetical protein IJ326_04220 [Lachnospiraceae bacterium]|nr:hypothetical protein [Lachnospiraceae bacterium]
MEQVIQAEMMEEKIRFEIEDEYSVKILQKEGVNETRALWKEAFPDVSDEYLEYYFKNRAMDALAFVESDEQQMVSMLHLLPYSAAMRRNPPSPGYNRLPCMADVVRVDTNFITGLATKEAYRNHGNAQRVLKSALEYQNRMKVPFTFMTTEQAELADECGFYPIYERELYELKKEQISKEMLQRAHEGEKIMLETGHVLSALEKSELLSLAHFVNANLCKTYGMFHIRSAVYYENRHNEALSKNGDIFVLRRDGKIVGYFVFFDEREEVVKEAIFEKKDEMQQFFYCEHDRKPHIMARIVNLPEILKHISSNGNVTVAIRINDPIMSENDGLFIWYLNEKGSYMERIEETEALKKYRPELTVSIGELTAFLFEQVQFKKSLKFDSMYLSGPVWLNDIA